MVRESRFIKVKQIPANGDELQETINSHFAKYGKVQSVKICSETPDDAYVEAVVAFTDIKVASQVYNEDQLLNGAAPLSVAFCDATGTAQSDARCPTIPVDDSDKSDVSDTESDRSSRSDGNNLSQLNYLLVKSAVMPWIII